MGQKVSMGPKSRKLVCITGLENVSKTTRRMRKRASRRGDKTRGTEEELGRKQM